MDQPTQKNVPAGFYPDKDGRQRYWDGNGWTDRTSDAQSSATATTTTTTKKRRPWLWPAIAGVALILGIIIGSAGKGGSAAVSPTAATTVTATASVTAPGTGSTSTVTAPPVTVTATAPPVTVTAAAPGPAAAFGDGTLVVGTDIQPGNYKALNTSGSCYFARLKDLEGGVNSIIANGNPSGPVTVSIKSTDKAFDSSRCGGWAKVS